MNVFELVASAAKTYLANLGAFSGAGFALLLASCITAGWLSAVLIADIIIAVSAGGEWGHWAKSMPHVAMALMATLAGLLAASALAFSLWGGFLNLCAKIIDRSPDAGVAEFAGYGISRGRTFFAIGLAQILLGMAFSIPAFVAGYFFLPAGVLLFLAAHAAAAVVFFFAYSAAALDGCGAPKAVSKSLKALILKPVAAVAAYLLCAIVLAAGIVVFPVYPIYYFVVASPIIAIVQITYYRKVKPG